VVAQKFLEQVMIAIPAPIIVQPDEKQVGLIEVFQQLLRVVLAGYGRAERPTMRPRIAVCTRKLRTWSGWRWKTSSARYRYDCP
jgi:hypothetical protein